MKKLIAFAFLAACSTSSPAPAPSIPTQTVAAVEQPDLASRRAQMIAWLDDYTKAGVFPTDHQGLPTSIFKDSRGVRCPMAELMFRSGHGDLVDAIAEENNSLQLADVHAGPVHDWMLGSGLTRDEIVMIQGAPRDLVLELPIEIQQPRQRRETILAQRERVRGRLEMAQAALRKDTRVSVQNALAALPDHRVPVVRVQRPVLARQ